MDASAQLELKKLVDRLVGIPMMQVLRAIDAVLWLAADRTPVEPRRIVLAKRKLQSARSDPSIHATTSQCPPWRPGRRSHSTSTS